MEKEELIKKVAEKAEISEDEAVKILDAFTASIKEGLSKGEKIAITGFGTFSLSKRKAQTFTNPKTQEVYDVPERVVPLFKAGKNLHDSINDK